MTYGNLERSIDRQLARDRRAPERPPTTNRGKHEPITIYLQPIIATEETKLHCFFCGHPFIEIRNKVLYVSAYPGHTVNKVSSDTISCKRCKQRYIKLV